MKIYQVDAFAAALFQGNPAAVVPLTEWLPDTMMQRIAMENNLAETAFIVPEGNDYLIRWFTPTVEVELCGHATLASGHIVFRHLGFKGGEVIFRSLYSGDLRVLRAESGDLALDFPANMPSPVEPSSQRVIFEGLGIAPGELYRGRHDYM